MKRIWRIKKTEEYDRLQEDIIYEAMEFLDSFFGKNELDEHQLTKDKWKITVIVEKDKPKDTKNENGFDIFKRRIIDYLDKKIKLGEKNKYLTKEEKEIHITCCIDTEMFIKQMDYSDDTKSELNLGGKK